jgi:hypothetical protein
MSFDYKKMLKKEVNIGLKDQRIRYIAAAVAAVASAFLGNIPLLLIAVGLAASGFTRWCPAYSGLGKSTFDPNEPAGSGCCGGSHHSSDHTEK